MPRFAPSMSRARCRGRRYGPYYHGGTRGDQMKPLLDRSMIQKPSLDMIQMKPSLDMIISDLHPHTIFEEPGFLRFFKSLSQMSQRQMSQCPPTSHATLSDLQDLMLKTTQIVQGSLERVDNVALSSEVWITTTNKTYMTTTCHLIDCRWARQSYVLETKPLPEDYKPSHFVGQLLKIADTWRLGSKIKVVVTNVDGMKRDVKKAGWDFIPCFANTLDVVFKETLEASSDWKELVQRCCEISEYFSHAEAQGQLKKTQMKMRLPQQKLVESKGDKWLSTLNMLERISEQHRAVHEVLLELKFDLLLSEHELKNIMKTTSCLKAFECVTSPAERYLSNIIPQVEDVRKKLLELQRGGNEFAKELAHHFNHHFSQAKENDWLTLSTALDLRYRDMALSDKNTSARIKNKIIAEMKHLAEESQGRSFRQPDNFHKDLRRYLDKKMLRRDWDPLAFWNFPKSEDWYLSEVARKYLAVVSTAVPADIAFDAERARLVASRRSNLEPEHLNMMLFLNGNRFLLS